MPLKDLITKGWENLRVIGNPPTPRVGAGFRDSTGTLAAYPTQLPFTPAVPVPWFLTAAALASLLPKAQWRREITFRNVCWEVRARLYLGLVHAPKTKGNDC